MILFPQSSRDWARLYFITLEIIVTWACLMVWADVVAVGPVESYSSVTYTERLAMRWIWQHLGVLFLAAYVLLLASIRFFARYSPTWPRLARMTAAVATVCLLIWLVVLPALH
jgi:hypothetical protein